MASDAEAPLQNVTIRLYREDVEALKRLFGATQGHNRHTPRSRTWQPAVREMVHEWVRSLLLDERAGVREDPWWAELDEDIKEDTRYDQEDGR